MVGPLLVRLEDSQAEARRAAAYALGRVLLAFGLLCLCASTIYLINDLVDIERDRLHPRKRNRPIASGEVSVPSALAASAACIAAALALGWLAGTSLAVLAIVGVINVPIIHYSVEWWTTLHQPASVTKLEIGDGTLVAHREIEGGEVVEAVDVPGLTPGIVDGNAPARGDLDHIR